MIDDASSDCTSEILDGILDSRIHLIRHDVNQGLVASLNAGLRVARGEFIARMDHDDIALPDRFVKQLAFFQENHSVGVLGTGYCLIDDKGAQGACYCPPVTHEEINWAMSFRCPLAHPTVMVRRELLLAHGGYSDSAFYSEDYDLWERMSYSVRFANLPEPLLLLRKHEDNMTNIWRSKNVDMGVVVSARRINFLLGEETDREIVYCLYTQGHVHSERVGEAQELVMRLVQVSGKHCLACRFIRRDAATLVAFMGLQSYSPSFILGSLIQAAKISPYFIVNFFNKIKYKLINLMRIIDIKEIFP